jgi:mannose-6-phosphate isomerase-like protein (cupin superfamily)
VEGVTRARIDFANDERFQLLRRELGASSFGLNVLTLQPRQQGRIHRHRDQEEVYIVLRGELTLGFDGEEVRVAEGEVVRVAPAVRRRVMNRGDVPVVVLAIGGTGEHVSRDGEAFTAWDDDEPKTPQDVPLPDDL